MFRKLHFSRTVMRVGRVKSFPSFQAPPYQFNKLILLILQKLNSFERSRTRDAAPSNNMNTFNYRILSKDMKALAN